jgi:hypothetical protein
MLVGESENRGPATRVADQIEGVPRGLSHGACCHILTVMRLTALINERHSFMTVADVLLHG